MLGEGVHVRVILLPVFFKFYLLTKIISVKDKQSHCRSYSIIIMHILVYNHSHNIVWAFTIVLASFL